MSISFGSINTGLPKDIVKQIMKAERIPLQNMEKRKGNVEAKKTLVEELISLVNGVQGDIAKNSNSRSLRELKVDTNESLVGVALDKNVAEPGNYQLEIVQLAQKSSAMSSGFEDRTDSYVGVGYIQYTLPNGENKEIYIDSNNSSLDGIAKLINKDTNNGLRATVINDGSGSENPWRLLLSLDKTGDENLAEFPYFYFVDGEDDLYLEFERKAQDAKVKIDGFEIEVGENQLKDMIPGATIDLKKAKPGEEFSIKISEDTEKITEKISGLVEKLNAILAFIKKQNTLDEKSDTSKTLGGDLVLQNLESRIRGAIFKGIKTDKGIKRFGDLGVAFQRDGQLALDEKKFNAMLANDYNSVSQILTGKFQEDGTKSDGFIDILDNTVTSVLRYPDGLLQSRRRSLNSNIEQIDRRIAQRERILQQKEKNLKDKFARLESTISEIKSQGAGISALGAAATNPVQQLG